MPLLQETAPDNRLPCSGPAFNVCTCEFPIKELHSIQYKRKPILSFLLLKKKSLEGTIHDRKMTSSTAHKIVL